MAVGYDVDLIKGLRAQEQTDKMALQDDAQAATMAHTQLQGKISGENQLQNTQLSNQGALERTALSNQGSLDIARTQFGAGKGVVGGEPNDPWKVKLGFANAGIIPGKVNPNVADDVTINAKKGEYIIPQEVVEVLGSKKLDKMVKDARKQIGVPHKTGPKRHDEPDAMGRMDDPRLGDGMGYANGTGKRTIAPYADSLDQFPEYGKNGVLGSLGNLAQVGMGKLGNAFLNATTTPEKYQESEKAAQNIAESKAASANAVKTSAPASVQAAKESAVVLSGGSDPSYAQAASAAAHGAGAGQAPAARPDQTSVPQRSDLEAYAKQVRKEAEGKHGMQYLGGDGKWKSVGNNMGDTPEQAAAKTNGQLVQDANGNWVQPLGGTKLTPAQEYTQQKLKMIDDDKAQAVKLKQMDVDAEDRKSKAQTEAATIKATAAAAEKDREEKSKHQQYAYKDAIEQYDWSGISPNAQHETATVMAKTAGKGYETFVHPDGKSGDMMIHPQLLKGMDPKALESAKKNPALFQELINRLHEAGGGQGIERLPVRNMSGLKRLKSSTT